MTNVVTTTSIAPAPSPASNQFKAIVRSLMPFVLGAIAALCARWGWHPTGVELSEIVGIVGVVLTIVVRALETKWPAFGILLGAIGAPVYPPSTKASNKSLIAQLQSQVATLIAQQEEASTPSAPSVASPAASPAAPVPSPTQ